MLLDAGRIWLYFFNRAPQVNLPPGPAGVFGVSFHVPQANVDVSSVGQPTSVSFSATSNPFNPSPSSLPSSSSSSSPSAAPFLSSTPLPASPLPLRQSSAPVHSSMWFAPTPDTEAGRRKRDVNMRAAAEQMNNPLDDHSSQHGRVGNSGPIDASYTVVSSPLDSPSSSASSVSDPSLSLLHSSGFIHPVLENLERNYGDLRVPPQRVARIKDYAHEDLRIDVRTIDTEEEAASGGKRKRKSAAKSEPIEVRDADTTVVSSHALPNA